jgi:hypothetical protein
MLLQGKTVRAARLQGRRRRRDERDERERMRASCRGGIEVGGRIFPFPGKFKVPGKWE